MIRFSISQAFFAISGIMSATSSPDSDATGPSINLLVEPCGTSDAINQTDFAELLYLNMIPNCEVGSSPGYCGVRRHQKITLIAKFLTKATSDQMKVRVHLVDKHFGFETAAIPEFNACNRYFNISCPHDAGMVNAYVNSELPREIPPLATIVRVRLVTVGAQGERNTSICRQIKLQVI